MTAADRPQPADLAFVPKRYPSHDYTGAGTIVRVYAGEAFVGHLTRRTDDGAVGWDASADPSTPAGTVRRYVSEALRMGAGQDRPLDDVWDDLLTSTQHADPYEGDLSTLVPRWPA